MATRKRWWPTRGAIITTSFKVHIPPNDVVWRCAKSALKMVAALSVLRMAPPLRRQHSRNDALSRKGWGEDGLLTSKANKEESNPIRPFPPRLPRSLPPSSLSYATRSSVVCGAIAWIVFLASAWRQQSRHSRGSGGDVRAVGFFRDQPQLRLPELQGFRPLLRGAFDAGEECCPPTLPPPRRLLGRFYIS